MPRKLSAFATPRSVGDDRLVLLVELVVVVRLLAVAAELRRVVHLRHALQGRRKPCELPVEVGRLLGSPRDDQRRARLVDQDVVDLVDDPERMAALDHLLQRRGHVVAQVVEAELGVGAVGDVRRVGDLLVLEALHVLQDADGHAERVVDRLHPLRVALCEVVVDRHEVDAVAGQRVEEDRQGGHQRLALAGLHLGDRAVVQHHPADHLHVVVAHAERAPRRLPAERERLVEQIVEGLAAARAFAQLVGLFAHLVVLEQLHLGLDRIDALDPLLVTPELPRLTQAQSAVDDLTSHVFGSGGSLPAKANGPAREG